MFLVGGIVLFAVRNKLGALFDPTGNCILDKFSKMLAVTHVCKVEIQATLNFADA